MKQLEPILFIVAILVVFYLLLIRPQQRRRKQQQDMQQAIRPGSEIVTTAGMYAKVVATEGDDALLLEVAPGVTCKYMRQAVMRVVNPDEATASVPGRDGTAPDAVQEAGAESGEPVDASSDGTGSGGDAEESPAARTDADEGDTAEGDRRKSS